MKVSKLAANLVGSEIIKIANQVNDLKGKGAEIANLTIGDLDSNLYPIPEELKTDIQQAYHDNLTNYPKSNGQPRLRAAVAKDLKLRWNLDYSADEVMIAAGARPLIYATFKTIVDPGDKVIFPVPSWNNNHYCFLSHANSVVLETKVENNFLPTAAELRPHLKGAVLLALCSPLNPTGTMFSKEQISEICEMILEENKSRGADEKPLYLMFDQIYCNLAFGSAQHYHPVALYPEMKDYVISIDGISKCLAATGVRVGWGFGPKEVIGKMVAFLTHVGAWSPKPEQEATGKFYEDKKRVDTFINGFKPHIQHSLDVLYKGVQALREKGLEIESTKPMGAFYLTIKINYIGSTTPDGSEIKDSTDLAFYLIHKAGVAFVPFSAFGRSPMDPWFRASVGSISAQEIEKMIPRLENALGKLKIKAEA